MENNAFLPSSAYKYLEKLYFLIPQKIRGHLPFFYFDIIKRMLPKNTETILDMGCSVGLRMELLKKNQTKLTGIEVWEPCHELAKQKGIFDELILGNIVDYEFKEKYDVVLLLFTLEHLTREDGIRVLDKIEKISKKKIFVSIPRGFVKQGAFKDASEKLNPHQEHKSGNWEKELKKRGYTLRGLDGWKGLRKKDCGLRGDKVSYPFYMILNIFSQLFTYFWWKHAPNLLAIKDIS